MDEHKTQLLKVNKAEIASMIAAANANRQQQIQVAPSYATNEPNESSLSDESTDYDDDLQAIVALRNQEGIKTFKAGLDDNL
ncbi:unnamed protein product [Toxocara canis]|nr:unnamed protein product [Toxocara canis]